MSRIGIEGSIRAQVREIAANFIKSKPNAVTYTEITNHLRAKLPQANHNTLHGGMSAFRSNLPDGITKVGRGLFVFGERDENRVEGEDPADASGPDDDSNFERGKERRKAVTVREQAFYRSFADWLVTELEEASEAHPLGGKTSNNKWATPDVIGLYQPSRGDHIQFPTEILAAEIKVSTKSLVTAFGQACAYKIFAHRVYLVVPSSASKEILKRLDALATSLGVGLVRFNEEDPDAPDYTVMVRAAKGDVDYFYTNQTMEKVGQLFGVPLRSRAGK